MVGDSKYSRFDKKTTPAATSNPVVGSRIVQKVGILSSFGTATYFCNC